MAAKRPHTAPMEISVTLKVLPTCSRARSLRCNLCMYRIMYELAVCSDGMTEAQPRSFRQNRPPASTLSDIMHTPLLTGAAVVRTRAPESEKKMSFDNLMQRSQERFRFLLP